MSSLNFINNVCCLENCPKKSHFLILEKERLVVDWYCSVWFTITIQCCCCCVLLYPEDWKCVGAWLTGQCFAGSSHAQTHSHSAACLLEIVEWYSSPGGHASIIKLTYSTQHSRSTSVFLRLITRRLLHDKNTFFKKKNSALFSRVYVMMKACANEKKLCTFLNKKACALKSAKETLAKSA